jgi:hypothetical protein
MSRVITFSRYFQKGHPKAGQPTHFVEKIWKSFSVDALGVTFYEDIYSDINTLNLKNNLSVTIPILDAFKKSIIAYTNYDDIKPKLHTIRAGKRWKSGDKFSPRVWSGKPYASKQIIIAPDIEIKRVATFEMDLNGIYSVDGKYTCDEDGKTDWILAQNDGLTDIDMFHWLMKDYKKPKEFIGQILIWTDKELPY